jgi:hypothetical protein
MPEPTEPNRPTPSRGPSPQPQPSPPTQPLPPAAGATPQGPPPTQGPPAQGPPPPAQGLPPQGPPPQGPPPAQGPPPYGPGGAGQPPPRQPGLWRQATSTRGGTIAVVVAACLAVLLVLGVVGTGLVVAARVVAGHDGGFRIERMADHQDGSLPPGVQKKLDRLPKEVMPRGPGPGARGQGDGPGQLLRGAKGLGSVQHGEFTVQGANGKATVMTLQRGSVTAATATKLTVKSQDGFSASYTLDSSTRGRTTGLSSGDEVTVLATKDGAKAVLVR